MMMTRRNNKNVECVDEYNVRYEVNDIENDSDDDKINDSDNYGKITNTDRVTDKKNCDDSLI